MDSALPCRRIRSRGFAWLVPALMAGWLGSGGGWPATPVSWVYRGGMARAVEPQPEAADPDADQTDDGESGVFLPTDRLKERQLDRARRLIADSRWSDAATLLDEILAAERDFFFKNGEQPATRRSTWTSIKSEAARLIGALPQAGREAYALQFRSRSERMLADAIAANDAAGIVAVARRWFATPAGQRAALLGAVDALESNQPLAAAAWLDRLAAADGADRLEPTLALMRAFAWERAGDAGAAAAILEKARGGSRGTARIAGRDVPISFPQGEGLAWLRQLAGAAAARPQAGIDWRQPRGDASRNALAAASRPLLVPRYRVPLARHPEESRLLNKFRRELADQGITLFPAGNPLAVDGTLLVHTPLGLLAVDFDTGKRIWMQPGNVAGRATGDEPPGGGQQEPLARGFDDATSGNLSSDGRLVFVVESHPVALASATAGPFDGGLQRQAGWQGGNTLSAYDIAAKGGLRWRLPVRHRAGEQREPGIVAGSAASAAWYTGAPLVVGDRLFVMVEEKAELRLDVLDATDGSTSWSQPLAELDESHAINGRESHPRRLAGLSPALGDGVLVCPLGAGSVVALDLATRTLLWAYDYARSARDREEAAKNNMINGANGGRLRGFPAGGLRADQATSGAVGRWCDDGPIVAGGSVLLTPRESDELHCLDLRAGTVRWKMPRGDRLLYVAGVVDGRVIAVGRDEVEALALDTGRPLWKRAFGGEGASPCGRGIMTAGSLFLPLDTPEVIEISLVDGGIVGRSPARGGALPGNLIAYRGEVISQGVDALDVFHQAAELEPRIETAARDPQRQSWAAVWRGQLALDRGDVREGLAQLRKARAAADARIAPDTLASGLAFALERDFAAASAQWRECLPTDGPTAAARMAIRIAVEGFMKAGNLPEAWSACRELLATNPDPGAGGLVDTPSDRWLVVAEPRWIRGRLRELHARAAEALRKEIDAWLIREVELAASAPDPVVRMRRLEAVVEQAGDLPAGMAARERLAADLEAVVVAAADSGEASRSLTLRREFLLLDLLRRGDQRQRDAASAAIAAVRLDLAGREPSALAEEEAAAWPLGRVAVSRAVAGRTGAAIVDETRSRIFPLAVENQAESFVPSVGVAYDPQHSRLLFTDRFGRPIGDPVSAESAVGRLGVPVPEPTAFEAAMLGRVAFVRTGGAVSAVELAGHGRGNRRLWTTADATHPASALAAAARFRGSGRGIPRNGVVPLGMRISEPEDALNTAASSLWGCVRTTGLAIAGGRSVAVLDPATGDVLWERHRLPLAAELIGDDDVLCVCTSDGRGSPVLSMTDGRLRHEVDLPNRRRRLLASGRRVLSIAGLEAEAANGVAATVRLELFDIVDRTTRTIGEFSGEARATPFAPGLVAVVDPAGQFTVIDVDRGEVSVRTRLPDMPDGIDLLRVVPWEDRLLACIGRHDQPVGDATDQRHAISAVQQMLVLGHQTQPMSFSIWAVDRTTGDLLWPTAATVARHCLHMEQPGGLPLLLFCRQIQPNHDREHTFLSVLCLDKRTGHAVLEDDRIPAQPHMLFGCDMIGDPKRHTIAVREHGGDPQRVMLEFKGLPAPPRPPHQSGGRMVKASGGGGLWDSLLKSLTPQQGR
jgi:outer membrane protein assembly factor BamB